MALIVFSAVIFSAFYFYKSSYKHLEVNTRIIAHAGGGLEGNKYLNSQEGFYYHYKNGTRTFEYDLVYSKDKKIIGTHRWEYHENYSFENRISYEDYVNYKILGKYTGVTLDFLFNLVREYSDIKIIIDTKEEREWELIADIAARADDEKVDIIAL